LTHTFIQDCTATHKQCVQHPVWSCLLRREVLHCFCMLDTVCLMILLWY